MQRQAGSGPLPPDCLYVMRAMRPSALRQAIRGSEWQQRVANRQSPFPVAYPIADRGHRAGESTEWWPLPSGSGGTKTACAEYRRAKSGQTCSRCRPAGTDGPRRIKAPGPFSIPGCSESCCATCATGHGASRRRQRRGWGHTGRGRRACTKQPARGCWRSSGIATRGAMRHCLATWTR